MGDGHEIYPVVACLPYEVCILVHPREGVSSSGSDALYRNCLLRSGKCGS